MNINLSADSGAVDSFSGGSVVRSAQFGESRLAQHTFRVESNGVHGFFQSHIGSAVHLGLLLCEPS